MYVCFVYIYIHGYVSNFLTTCPIPKVGIKYVFFLVLLSVYSCDMICSFERVLFGDKYPSKSRQIARKSKTAREGRHLKEFGNRHSQLPKQ